MYIHKETIKYYSALKKRNLAICDNMDGLDGIMLSEINQTEIDKYCMVSLMCGIKKKKKERKR